MNKKYLIWSIEHGAWWRPAHRGYTELRTEAGRYSYQEAIEILRSANYGDPDVPNEAIIEVED